VDAFLAAAYAEHGLTPNLPGDRAVLLRRVYLDLVGLPPTRQELHAFLTDPDPEAYEKVVDHLLASPQYGERWARHWMDVWRYSDWYGRRSVPDVMNSYPQIWRWRDWIVRSLNRDKGYDRMVLEMLAADEIAPTDDADIVATGFLVRNWFKWNYNQWMRDNVEHTGKAFLGLTLNCCHCHDHKYDPITQKEYFQFRAFFEPLELRHDRVAGEADPGPFKKYVYAESYGPIASGMIRLFDEKLDAPTFMYIKGDERNRVPGQAPVLPAAPAALGGDQLRVEPVDLPPAAWYPGLKQFVQQEETAKRQAAVAQAEAALVGASSLKKTGDIRVAEARLTAAKSELASIQSRIAADNARYLHGPGNASSLAKVAARAEKQAAVDKAMIEVVQAEQAMAQARARTEKDPKKRAEVQQAEKQEVSARQTLTAARAALAGAGSNYTPLSPQYPHKSTGRRTALARWIASKDNPLTARVAVNHMWGWHFGRPLVETTFNFGRSGKRPSHPALLDWLAVQLMDNNWRMKDLHRLIVTSTAYRMRSSMGSADNPNRTLDPDNHFFWHFPLMRMEAEVIRDSVLAVAGELDASIGGHEIPHEQGLACHRRSLYFAHHGESKMQFLELFDGVNACDGYQRSTSVLPQQALALSNSELSLHQGRILAHKLWDVVGTELPPGSPQETAFIRAAFEQVLGRPPTAREQSASAAFLTREARLFQDSKVATLGVKSRGGETPSSDPATRAREDLIQALLNHNDFVTVR
jgi:hypothetical protein